MENRGYSIYEVGILGGNDKGEIKFILFLMFLGVFDPVENYKGRCIAVIHRTNDDDDKIIVVPDGVNYTDDQIKALTEFQERFFESVIIR